MTELHPAPVVDGRRLDWFPRFDEASRAYAVAPDATALPTRGRLWNPGRVLDQGAEGACCGFAAAAEAAAEPVPVRRVTNRYARGWYLNARRRDEWPGEAYDGTSVLATMKEGHARGLYGRYGWFFTVEQLAHGIVRDEAEDGGPAIIGVEWLRGSYSTDPAGVLRPSGERVGGHALCVLGVVVPADLTADDEPGRELRIQLVELGLLDAVNAVLEHDGEDCAFVLQNSWGLTFGRGGLCVVAVSTVRGWFASRGEFAQPQQRQLPASQRKGTNVTETDEQPEESGDTTLHITAGEVEPGDRVLDPPEDVGQESATVREVEHVRGYGGRQVRLTTTAGSFTLNAGVDVTVRRPQ